MSPFVTGTFYVVHQVIYHNAASQSVFRGSKLQTEQVRGDLRAERTASLLFHIDP